MIEEIITTGEYRAPLFDKSQRLEQFAITLPFEIRNELGDIDVKEFITNGILDFINEFAEAPYKNNIWIWIHALESFVTIEGFVNTDSIEQAIELADDFGYDCFFDLIDDETVYI